MTDVRLKKYLTLIDLWENHLKFLKSSLTFNLPCSSLLIRLLEVIDEYDFLFDDLELNDLIPVEVIK